MYVCGRRAPQRQRRPPAWPCTRPPGVTGGGTSPALRRTFTWACVEPKAIGGFIYRFYFHPLAFFFPLGLCLPKKHTIGILLPQTCCVLGNEDVSPHRSCPARLKGPDAPAFATGPRSRRAARPVIGATLSDGLRSVPTFRKVR